MRMRVALSMGALGLALSLGACKDSSTSAPPPPQSDAEKKAAEIVNTVKKEGEKAAETVKNEAASMSDAVKAEAEKLIAEATQYIKENKLDLAEKSIAGLDKIRPQLNAEWQGRVDQVKTLLENAKKTGMLKNADVPKMPG